MSKVKEGKWIIHLSAAVLISLLCAEQSQCRFPLRWFLYTSGDACCSLLEESIHASFHSQNPSQAFTPAVWSRRNFFLHFFTPHPSVVLALFCLFCNSMTLSHIHYVIDYVRPATFSSMMRQIYPYSLAISSFQAAPEDLGDNSARLVSHLASCTRDFTVSSHFCVTAQLTIIKCSGSNSTGSW